MLIKKIIKRIPSLFREGILLFCIGAIICSYCSCDTSKLTLIDLLQLEDGQILLAVNHQNKNHLIVYRDGIIETWGKPSFLEDVGQIKKLTKLNDSMFAVITEKNGIFLYPIKNNTDTNPVIHLPVEDDALADKNIRAVYFYNYNNDRKLYVIYGTPKGSGATEVLFKNGWAIDHYATLDITSSELRSNNLIQIEIDMKGNTWFNYSRKEEKGVSRLSPKGEWVHFDRNNSELPDKFVRYLRSEGPDDGVSGDNVWFASVSGLTRLEYKPGQKDEEDREKWKLYGERESTGGIIARAMGIRELVSDAVLDLIDLHVTDKLLLMANTTGVYTFNGRSINRFIPDTSGGLNETQVKDINYRDGYVIVKTRPLAKQNQYVDSVCLLDIKKRKWIKVKLWDFDKNYPRNIYFIPYKKGIDFVALDYMNSATKFAFFDYETLKLKKIEITVTTPEDSAPLPDEKTNDDPKSEGSAPVDQGDQ